MSYWKCSVTKNSHTDARHDPRKCVEASVFYGIENFVNFMLISFSKCYFNHYWIHANCQDQENMVLSQNMFSTSAMQRLQ